MGLRNPMWSMREDRKLIELAPSTAAETLSARRPAMGAPIPTASGQGVIIKPVSTWLR